MSQHVEKVRRDSSSGALDPITLEHCCYIKRHQTITRTASSYLTIKSSSSGRVSRRCRLERARGGVEGGSRKSFSSCSVLTKQGTSPTNAWASLAVMALENPRPCKERRSFSKHLARARSWKSVWPNDTSSFKNIPLSSDGDGLKVSKGSLQYECQK